MAERGNNILRWCDRYLGIPLAHATAVLRPGKRRAAMLPNAPRIGVLCLGAIGDLLLASGLINGLRNTWPDASLEVVASSANACALDLLGSIDRRTCMPVGRPDRIARHLRNAHHDLLIDTSQWARLGNILGNLSGARLTVGFATPGQYRGAGYDLKVGHRADVHELENFLNLGRALNPDFCGQARLAVPSWQAGHSRRIVCHFWPAEGKGRELKQWPWQLWARLIRQLIKAGFSISLSGGAKDREGSKDFVARYLPGADIQILAGQISLAQLAEKLQNCSALISVNTGIMHLGALLGVPTIGLHGPTNPARWGPVGRRVVSLVPASGNNCYLNLGFEYPADAVNNMGSLSVESVFGALETLGVI